MHLEEAVRLGCPDCLAADEAGHSMPRIERGEGVEAGGAGGAAREQEIGAYACGLDGLKT